MKTNSHSVRINFFGIGCRIIKGEFDEATWRKFFDCSKKIKSSFAYAVFDSTFFDELQLPKYKSWDDFGNRFQLSGLLCDRESYIEIRINNRQRRKIFFEELFCKDLLFPVYETSIHNIEDVADISPKSLIGVEKEIGTIASYKFECFDFTLDKLHFVLHKFNISGKPYTVLSKIAYNGRGLLKCYSDTLVKENFVLYDHSIKSLVA